MTDLYPRDRTREQVLKAIGFGFLVPGAGHLVTGRTDWAVFWFLLCQGMLFGGLALAGNAQLDYGTWLSPGGIPLMFALFPEVGNFSGSWAAGLWLRSVEGGGYSPDVIPLRHLGYVISGAGGILAAFSCAHAAGMTLIKHQPPRANRIHPGTAALATLALPGFGHWLIGRKFKARLFFIAVFGLFLIGLALGEFADFDRQRHPYYWIGQMLMGLPAWLLYLPLETFIAKGSPPYADAGTMFTTCAGLFNLIASLDAYHRAEKDCLADGESQ